MIKQSISTFTELFKSGKYLLLNSLIEKVIFFVFFALLARMTVPELYGQIITVNAFSNILSSFFEFGLGSYIQREASFSKKRIKSILDIAVLLKFAGFLLIIPIVLLYFQNSLISFTIILLITFSNYLLSSFSIFTGSLFGLQKFDRVFFSLIKARLIFFGLIVINLVFLPEYVYLIITLFLSTSLYGFFLIRESYCSISIQLIRKIKWKEILKLIRSAAPFGLGIIFVWVYDRVDVLLLEKFIGLKAVADYSVAYSVYKLPRILSGILLMPLYSKFSTEYSFKKKIAISEVFDIGFILVFIASVFIFCFVFFGEEIISIIFGQLYSSSWWILALLSSAIPGLFLNNLTGVTLNSMGRERLATLAAGIGLVFNIGFNLFLIPRFLILGAILSTIISEYSVFIIQYCFFIKNR